MEALPVKEGNIRVAWDLEGQAGYWLILSTDTYDVLLQGDFPAGTQEADIAVEDVLEENVLYCFCVSSLSNNGTIALFTIIREAGSGTKAASSPQQPSSRQVTGPSRHPVYRLAPDEKDSQADTLLAEGVNRIVEKIYENGVCRENGSEYIVYAGQETDAGLTPLLHYLPSGETYGSIGDADSMEKDLRQTLKLVQRITGLVHQAEEAEDPSALEKVKLARGKVEQVLLENKNNLNAFVPLHAKAHNLSDALLFGVILENGEWVDHAVYMAVRFFVEDKAVICLMTDQELIEEYMALIGVQKAALTADLKITNWLEVPDKVQLAPLQAYGEASGGTCIAGAYNEAVQAMLEKGYGSETDEQVYYYAPTQHSALMNPAVLVLSGTNSAGKTADQTALETDFQTLLKISLERSLNPDQPNALSPMAAEIAQLMEQKKVSYQPLGYASGEIEYFVFALVNTESGERMEEQFYLLSRTLSQGGTAHLCLFEDHGLIQQAVSLDRDHFQFLVPPYEEPSGISALGTVKVEEGGVNVRAGFTVDAPKIGMIKQGEEFVCIGIADNGWYKILLEDGTVGYVSHKLVKLLPGSHYAAAYAHNQKLSSQLDEALNTLLHDAGKTSYARAAMKTAEENIQSKVFIASKFVYDVLTDPLGEAREGLAIIGGDWLQGKNTFLRKSEEMLTHILRDSLSQPEASGIAPEAKQVMQAVQNIYDAASTYGQSLKDAELSSAIEKTDGAADFISLLYSLVQHIDEHNVHHQKVLNLVHQYARNTHILTQIKAASESDPVIVAACSNIQKEMDVTLQELLDWDSMKGHAEWLLNEGAQAAINEVINKVFEWEGQAVLLAGKAGEFLTNNTSAANEQGEQLVILNYLDHIVTRQAEKAIGTEYAYPMMELSSAVKLQTLEAADSYYNAYCATAAGAFNAWLGGFDIQKANEEMEKQKEFVREGIAQQRLLYWEKE